MNASKRKFNALLSSFGNKPSASLSSKSDINNGSVVETLMEGDTGLQAKKRRLGHSVSAIAYETRHRTPALNSSVRATNMAHTKSLSLASGRQDSTDSPKYAPWDRAAFLKRLETFRSVTDWTPKPTKVNEVEWAKRGWICKGWERVRCELCDVEILVKLNVKEVDGEEQRVLNASEIEQGLVEKYAQLIITSHAESCLWRQRGCDETIFKLPLNHAPSAANGLRVRYNALCDISERLPFMHNIHPPEDFSLDVVISYLPRDFLSSANNAERLGPSMQPEINRVAMVMALFGWTARPETRLRDGAAFCEACFRTLGLWLFKSKEVNDAGEMVHPATMNHLDPVEQHREYCPWRSPKSQSGGTPSKSTHVPELAAWQVLVRVLKNDYILRQTGKETTQDKTQVIVESGSRPRTAIATDDDEDAQSIREEKDKERWARLRRVKSLFDTKSRKLQKSPPGVGVKSKGPI